MKLQNIIVLSLLFFIYHVWFSFSETLSSGDWPYLFVENIKEFSFLPNAKYVWLAPYYQIPAKLFVQYLGVPWHVFERLFWFLPFIILSTVSSYILTKSWIGVLIYVTNTYVLMLVGGGQMGVALAYSIAPFVLGRFINLIDRFPPRHLNIKYQILNSKYVVSGLLLAILTMFDPRIAYVILFAILIYYLLVFRKTVLSKEGISSFVSIIILPLAIAGVLNSYWIIPLFNGNLPMAYQGLGSVEGFKFFSFADFSHSFSLLHPNWPENIFGKTYFMKTEFIAIPILAYSSLFFLNSSKLQLKSQNQVRLGQKLENSLTMKQFNNETIVFFALLGLFGAFLAKGTNEPFAFINFFLFEYIPGMNMFRDPTKFYLLVALSYSVLIPFSVRTIYEWLSSKFNPSTSSGQNSKLLFKVKNRIPELFLLFAIYYLLFLIRPALVGELSGTFKSSVVPKEYIRLKDFFAQKDYTKTLWIPKRQRFGFTSKKHLSFDAVDLFKTSTPSAIVSQIRKKQGFELIQSLGTEYIVVPFDVKGELFFTDRRYDAKKYEETINAMMAIEWLKRIDNFEKIGVFYVVKQ